MKKFVIFLKSFFLSEMGFFILSLLTWDIINGEAK
jgi:hypothetical protein